MNPCCALTGRRTVTNALNNEKEYFAEACEAFFGTNDFYPFTRAELKEHDPEMFKVLCEVWGVGGQPPSKPHKQSDALPSATGGSPHWVRP